MNTKAIALATAIVTSCSGVELLGSALLVQPPPPSQADIAVRTWLDCDECTNGELQAVVKLGAATVPILAGVLRSGPSKERLETHRQFLVRRYAAMREYQKTHPSAVVPQTESEFVQRYVDKYDSLQRMRSVRALEAIGGAAARTALQEALKSPLRPDVLEVVKASLARLKG
jgi:hypothetical protein